MVCSSWLLPLTYNLFVIAEFLIACTTEQSYFRFFLKLSSQCIWPSWCYCHSLSLASVKSRLVLPFWYRLTWVVPEKGPLNGCVCVCKFTVPSVLWRCWLGSRKGIQPVKRVVGCRCGCLACTTEQSYFRFFLKLSSQCLQCFDAVGWAAGRASGL